MHLHLGRGAEVHSPREVDLGSDLLTRFHAAALAEGVFMSHRGTLNVSTPMDDERVRDVLERMDRAATRVADQLAVA